jgi:hypothetical protein
MYIKTILAVILLTSIPGLSLAQGCSHATNLKSASQCEVGQVWDAVRQTCASPVSS